MALAIDFALIYFLFFTKAAAIARLRQLLYFLKSVWFKKARFASLFKH